MSRLTRRLSLMALTYDRQSVLTSMKSELGWPPNQPVADLQAHIACKRWSPTECSRLLFNRTKTFRLRTNNKNQVSK